MAAELKVEPGEFRRLARKTTQTAGEVTGVVSRLVSDAGPDRIERAMGNYASRFPLKDAASIVDAMRSIGTAMTDGYAPALSSMADMIERTETASTDELMKTPDSVTGGY